MLTFKTTAQQQQFSVLQRRNPSLAAIVTDLNLFTLARYGKPIVITEVDRSNLANTALYKVQEKTTAHAVSAAIDIKSSDFLPTQIAEMITFLKRYDKTNTWGVMTDSRTVLYHAIPGGALHFHIQYTGPLVRMPLQLDNDMERRVAHRQNLA